MFLAADPMEHHGGFEGLDYDHMMDDWREVQQLLEIPICDPEWYSQVSSAFCWIPATHHNILFAQKNWFCCSIYVAIFEVIGHGAISGLIFIWIWDWVMLSNCCQFNWCHYQCIYLILFTLWDCTNAYVNWKIDLKFIKAIGSICAYCTVIYTVRNK